MRLRALVFIAGSTTAAAVASAQVPPAGPSPGAPPETEAPAAASGAPASATRPPGYRVHDGFFLRLSDGIGVLQSWSTNQTSDPKAFTAGFPSAKRAYFGGSGEISIGASVIPGLALGGIFSAQVADDDDGTLLAMGAVVDVYPDPRRGLHGGGLIAYGYTDHGLKQGLTYGAHVGYDAWVGGNWSLGAMLRVLYAPYGDSSVKCLSQCATVTWTNKMLVPQLLFSATFN
jgi:hypothetical protein